MTEQAVASPRFALYQIAPNCKQWSPLATRSTETIAYKKGNGKLMGSVSIRRKGSLSHPFSSELTTRRWSTRAGSETKPEEQTFRAIQPPAANPTTQMKWTAAALAAGVEPPLIVPSAAAPEKSRCSLSRERRSHYGPQKLPFGSCF